MVRTFMKCMHVCAAQLSLPNYKPSLADEKAEPRPDMSINTISEKSIYIDVKIDNRTVHS